MRICTFQVAMSSEIGHNVETIARCFRVAAANHADLAVFPELMLIGYDQHLHEVFQQPTWYAHVLDGVQAVEHLVVKTGVKALVGTPYRVEAGYQNAIVLVDPTPGVRYVGGRMLEGGWQRWGFVSPARKAPVRIGRMLCGFIVCNEVSHLDTLTGSGLEDSAVIFWPCASFCNDLNDAGELITDNCREGGITLATTFRTLVIQAGYINTVNPLAANRTMGGIVIVDAHGTVLQQAPYEEEAYLLHGMCQGF